LDADVLAVSRRSAATKGGAAVIHFIHFWHALGEFRRRLRKDDEDLPCGEPIAEEAAAFRDTLLRDIRDGVLTAAKFSAAVSTARSLSEDPPAWDTLVAAVSALEERFTDSSLSALGIVKVAEAAEEQLPLHEVSMILLMWLPELTEDYRRGFRGACIQSVRDVLRCSARQASENLCATDWDVEAALRRFYTAGGPPLVANAAQHRSDSWGSHSAKLCSSESKPG
jgi:hypothetical protein